MASRGEDDESVESRASIDVCGHVCDCSVHTYTALVCHISLVSAHFLCSLFWLTYWRALGCPKASARGAQYEWRRALTRGNYWYWLEKDLSRQCMSYLIAYEYVIAFDWLSLKLGVNFSLLLGRLEIYAHPRWMSYYVDQYTPSYLEW